MKRKKGSNVIINVDVLKILLQNFIILAYDCFMMDLLTASFRL